MLHDIFTSRDFVSAAGVVGYEDPCRHLVVAAETLPDFADRFEEVKLWQDWPGRGAPC